MPEQNNELLQLTADIVAAHVSNNNVAVNDLPVLVRQVHDALSGLGAPEEEAPAKRQPMVSPRSAIKPDSITCLVCGAKAKMLKRHLGNAHGMTPSQYRDEFGLRSDYPMVAPNYAEQRSQLAKKIGLGRKGGSGSKSGDKAGGTGAQKSGGGGRAKAGGEAGSRGRRAKAEAAEG